MRRTTLALLALACLAHVAEAQCYRVQCPPRAQSPLRYVHAAPAQAGLAPQAVAGDPYGFGPWLNGQRAARGLAPLACDAGLCQDAAANSSRGFGHSYMGRARRQNAGLGPGQAVWPMWVASGAHASALFDPTVSRYGIALVGNVWTFGAY